MGESDEVDTYACFYYPLLWTIHTILILPYPSKHLFDVGCEL